MGKARTRRREQARLTKEKTMSIKPLLRIGKNVGFWVVGLFAHMVGNASFLFVLSGIAAVLWMVGVITLSVFLTIIASCVITFFVASKAPHIKRLPKLWQSIVRLALAGLIVWGGIWFYVWAMKQYHQRIAQKQTLEEKSKNPIFGGYLKDALVTGSENWYRLIIVTGEIKNSSGPSSSITDWRMFLRFPDGTNIEGEDVPISDSDKLMHFKGSANDNFSLKKEKYLPDRGIESLKEGDAIQGWFCKKFKDDDIGNAQDKKAVVIVTFSDAWDNIHSYQINMPRKNDTNFPKSF